MGAIDFVEEIVVQRSRYADQKVDINTFSLENIVDRSSVALNPIGKFRDGNRAFIYLLPYDGAYVYFFYLVHKVWFKIVLSVTLSGAYPATRGA
jgi:hypothetical protein